MHTIYLNMKWKIQKTLEGKLRIYLKRHNKYFNKDNKPRAERKYINGGKE